jgi:hypothetical protein
MFATPLARLAALSVIAFAGLTASAFAAEQAFTKGPANLRDGPGTAYDVIVTLPQGTEVAIEACTSTWCAVTTEDNDEGFIARSLLILASDFLDPEDVEEDYDEEEATVCFYTQANYRGASMCVEEGEADNDMPGSFDNNIESIQITGGLGVEVCTGFNHGGECRYYTESRRALPNYLRNRITSYAVEEDFNGPNDKSEYIVMQ